MADTIMPIFGISAFVLIIGRKYKTKPYWPVTVGLASLVLLMHIGLAFNGLYLFMRTCDFSPLPTPYSAGAVEVTVGQTRIELTAPKGYCALDNKHEANSRLLAEVRHGLDGHNALLGMFWPCDSLNAWHEGNIKFEGARDTLQYQVSFVVKDRLVSPSLPQEMCSDLQKQGPSIIGEANKRYVELYKKLKGLAEHVEFGSIKFYGVLRQDVTGCYFGEVMKEKIDGKEYTRFIVVGSTVVKRKMISSYFQAELKDENTIQRLLELSQKNIAVLRERNRWLLIFQ